MDFKKIAGYLVALFVVWNTPTAVLADSDISSRDTLNTYMTSGTGTGSVINSFALTSAVTSAATEHILTSSGAGVYDITGNYSISSNGNLQVYGLNIASTIAMSDNTTLTLGLAGDNRNFQLDQINAYNLTMNSGGTVTLSANTTVGNDLRLTAGTLALGATTTNVTGKVIAEGGNITRGGGTTPVLQSNGYEQTAGNISLGTLTNTANGVTLSGDDSVLTLTNLGTDGNNSDSFTQNGGTFSSDFVYLSGDAQINGGQATITHGMNAANVTVNGGTLSVAAGTAENKNFINTTQLSSTNGNLNLDSNVSVTATGAVGISNDVTIGENSSISGSSISVTGGSVNNGGGNVGTLIVSGGAGSSYNQTAGDVTIMEIQATGASVTVSGGSIDAQSIGKAENIAGTMTYTRVGSYTQTGNDTHVKTVQLISSGDISLSDNGTLDVPGTLNTEGALRVSGGELTSTSITAGSLYLTGGKIDSTNAQVTVTGTSSIQGGTIKAGTLTTGSYTQTGADAASSTATLTNLVSTGAVNVSGGTLTVGTLGEAAEGGARPSSYAQTGNSIVQVTNMYVNGNVSLSSGQLTLMTLADVSGDFTVSGASTFINNATANNFKIGGTFSQEGTSTVTVGDNKTLTAASYTVNNGTVLQLGSNASVVTTSGFTVDGGTVKDSDDPATALGTGTINAGRAYTQKAGSQVSVENLVANYVEAEATKYGSINIQGGGLTAKNIGTTENPVASYTQTNGNVQTAGGNVTGNVSVTGGSLTLLGTGSESFTATGSYTQNGTTVTIEKDTLQAASASISNGATLNLNEAGKLKTDGGNISLTDSVITNAGDASANRNQTAVEAGGQYDQTGQTSALSVYQLKAGSSINLGKYDETVTNGGSITATYIDTDNELNIAGSYDDASDSWLSTINATNIRGASIIQHGGSITATNLGTTTGANAKRITSLSQYSGEINTQNVYSTGDIKIGSADYENSVVKFTATGVVNTSTGGLSIIKSSGDAASTTAEFSDTVTLGGTGNYIQTGSTVTASKGITAGGSITIDDGATLTTGGSVSTSAGGYTQTGATNVTVNTSTDATKTNLIAAKVVTIGDNEVASDNPTITLNKKTGISGEQVIVNSATQIISAADADTSNPTSITISGSADSARYDQSGTAQVNVINLAVSSVVGTNPAAVANIQSGTFTAENVGSNSNTATFQNITIGNGTSTPTVTVDNMYAWNTITLSSGTVTAEVVRAIANSSNEYGNVTVSGGTLNLTSTDAAVTPTLFAYGTYQQKGGTVNVGENGVLSARASFQLIDDANNKINLADGAVIKTTGTNASAGNIVLEEGQVIANGTNKSASIEAGYNYTQSDNGSGVTVDVDSITAGNNIAINKGTTTAKTIKAKNNGTYTQALTNGGTISVNANNIEAYNIVIGGKSVVDEAAVIVDGGSLTLGDATTASTLAATNTIKIYGSNENTILNFNNTTVKATSQNLGTSNSAVSIEGVKMNLLGTNNIGAYTDASGNDKIINSIVIGNDTSANQTLLNIGTATDTSSILNLTAGDNGITMGANLATTNYGTLNMKSSLGDISFATGSNAKLTNSGTINMSRVDNDTKIVLGNINTSSSKTGTINNGSATDASVLGAYVNLQPDAKVYTSAYNQYSGSTSFSGSDGTGYNELYSTGNINIAGGSFDFNGNAKVTSDADFTMTNAQLTASNGTTSDTAISAKNITITGNSSPVATPDIQIKANAVLSLKPTLTAQIEDATTTLADGAKFTIDTSTSGSSATVEDSSFVLTGTSELDINGNTTFTNTTTNIGNDATLRLNSTSGNITLDSDSAITTTGSIIAEGTTAANKVVLNNTINTSTTKQGYLGKDGSGELDINANAYLDSLTFSNGTVKVNADVATSSTATISGNASENQTVNVEVADGKSITAEGVMYLGSEADYNYTNITLGDESSLKGSTVRVNANVDMTHSTIEATATDGGVIIGRKSNIDVKNDGTATTTTSTIKATTINILGGSVINIEDNAALKYIGTVVNSSDAHYDVQDGGIWSASNGTYTNQSYTYDATAGTSGKGAILNNAGSVELAGGSASSPMTFTGSFAGVNGGAISTSATGTTELYNNISFTENKTAGQGGAIYNTGAIKAHLYNTTNQYAQNTKFTNNRAGFSITGSITEYGQDGGAIYNGVEGTNNGTILLGDSASFSNNVSTGEGGAIYNSSASTSAVKIGKNATFLNNISYGDGGAISADAGTVTIDSGASFTSNTAGIGLNGSSDPYASRDGGAISIANGSTVDLGKNATFTSNSSTQNGGAISNQGTLILDGSSSTKDDYSVTFLANAATGLTTSDKKGGAVYNSGTISTTDENGNTINGFYRAQFGSSKQGNEAQYGGAIYQDATGTFVINNSSFIGNKATSSTGANTYGGAIYNANGTLDVQKGSIFQSNTASGGYGGAIYNAAGATLNIAEGLSFGAAEYGNTANYGGAIYNAGTLDANGTSDEVVNFVANEAVLQGGALYNTADDVSLQYAAFTSNKAGSTDSSKNGQGGAIYNTGDGVSLQNVTISSNKVQGINGTNYPQGGAIYNAGEMSINAGTVISGNTAEDTSSYKAQGGAIYNAGTLTIASGSQTTAKNNALIQSNTANGFGGGIFNSSAGTVNLSSGAVIGGSYNEYSTESTPTYGNSAVKGGGIYNEGTLNFANSGNVYIIGNNASSVGGGLYNIANSAFSTANKNIVFYGNSVVSDNTGYGGALYNALTNTQTAANETTTNLVTISNAEFTNNSAEIGSAIYNEGLMAIDSTNTFKANKYGSIIGNEGILYLASGYSIVGADELDDRNAGFLWNQDQNGVVKNALSSATNNQSGVVNISYQDGGTALTVSKTGYIDSDSNIGAVDGAAIHLTDNSTINTIDVTSGTTEANTIKNAEFSENIGHAGGALYKDSSVNLTLTNVKFSSNTAYEGYKEGVTNSASGGAIYNAGKDGITSTINLSSDVTFKNNASTAKGGAIYNGIDGIVNLPTGFVLGETVSGYSNIAQIAGGGIANEGTLNFNGTDGSRTAYFTYQGGGVTVSGTNIYNGNGGAIYIGAKGAVNTTIDGNTSSNTLNNIVFANNESINGGALYNESTTALTINNSQFSGNRGYANGGAVYAGENSITKIYLDADSSNLFTGNQAGNTMSSIAASGQGGAVYNAGTMDIYTNADDGSSETVFVNNTAIGSAGTGGAIYNTGTLTVHGNTKFYKNSASASGGAITTAGGSLILALDKGDIEFDQNSAASGSAIFSNGSAIEIVGDGDDGTGTTYSLTFKDADTTAGTPAQTIASTGSNAMSIKGGQVNFLSDASGYTGSYYQTGGKVTVANKFINMADAPIKAVTGGTLIFEDGAQLVSDELMVSNNELNSKAKVIFNENESAKLSDLSALYDAASTNNYFTYGNDTDGYHKIVLRAADVEINDAATISQAATIGNANNSYAVRNLTLSNGATLGNNITVVGDASAAENTGATLTLGEGAVGSDAAGVYLKDYNANLVITNTKTPITLGGTIKNDGAAYNSSITKSGDGDVVISGDASGYNGNYAQSGGTVQFTKGSKFFGANTKFVDDTGASTITGGKLQVDDGTEFSGPVSIKMADDAEFSTSSPSEIDLTGTSGALLTMGDPLVTVEFGQNAALEVTSNSTVNAQKDEIYIGNANLQVNSVVLGGNSQGSGSVNVTVNPNTSFILQNDAAATDPSQVGKGGVLGFGSNVNFKDSSGTTVVPTVELKDYTQLKFTNESDSKIAVNIESKDATSWADKNGDIVKENAGKITIDGEVDKFYGSIILRNGELDTNGDLFNTDVKFDLSELDDDAVAVVNNVINSNNLYLDGDIGTSTSTNTYNLTVNNTKGNIELRDSSTSTNYNDVYVKNGSTASFNSAGVTNINDLVIKDSTVKLLAGGMNVFGNMSMGSTYNMMNGAINTLNVAGNLTLTDDSDFLIDINPILNQSDTVVIGGNLASDSTTVRSLDVSDWNLLSEPVAAASVYNVFNVQGSVDNVVFTTSKSVLNTPIANYTFSSLGNGSYMLARNGYTSTAYAVPVAVQAGYMNQLASYDMAFGNLDTVMTLPVLGYDNQYANAMDDTIVYSPLFIPELEKGIWFRPYGNFEKVEFDDGPDVDNQSYGAYVGGDTPLTELGKGFQGNMSAYIGYNGSHQSFSGTSNYQNAGTVGVTGALYKGGFFSGLTVNVTAGGNDSSTPYGKTDFFMLGVGVASKTGYNWELARGKFIIQPSWLMSYSFVNPFSPGNLAGYNVDADGLHGVQLSPQIKFIANLPYGWQPYALFNFRWNLADDAKVTINSVDIPEISIKPYVEYGIGVQKRWGERFTGYGQFLGRGIGRNGVGLNFGFRWSVGQGR